MACRHRKQPLEWHSWAKQPPGTSGEHLSWCAELEAPGGGHLPAPGWPALLLGRFGYQNRAHRELPPRLSLSICNLKTQV